MRTMNIACGICIGVIIWLAVSLMLGGCGPAPESFHRQPVECVRTPGDLYSYACPTEGYERCLTPAGEVKYSDCEYMGIICVASCP